MRFPVKYLYAFLAFLFAFGCIYSINVWHQQRLIEEPLSEALMQIEGIEDAKLTNDRKTTEVWITLNEVENLPQTYESIEKILQASYKQGSYKINLVDNRDPYLESVYYKVHFALLEGEKLGNYSTMSEKVFEQLSGEERLKNYRLWVDQKRIYLLLTTSQNNLYEVITVAGEEA